MTDHAHTPTTDDRIITALAKRLLDDDDLFDAALDNNLDDLANLLTEHAFIRLCLAIDFCPEHRCDLDTCADDDRDCLKRYSEIA